MALGVVQTVVRMGTLPLLVGEVNTATRDPRAALWPFPFWGSGGRLRRLLGLSTFEYLARFERLNLCTGVWDAAHARISANLVRFDAAFGFHSRGVVLLGARVCRAFEVDFRPFSVARQDWGTVAVLPHPSGRCRVWNVAHSDERARDTLRRLDAETRSRACPWSNPRPRGRAARS